METMHHSFFMSLPIRGVKAYYMHEILRDRPDTKCLMIPSQRKAAMKPAFPTIIIDEIVIPDKGNTLTAAQLAIKMTCALVATEYTGWLGRAIMDTTSLVIEKIWTKTQEEDSIMVLVPKPAEH